MKSSGLAKSSTSVSAKSAVKSLEVRGKVIVGEQTAMELSKKLHRIVLPGEEFDLGTLAYTNKNPFKHLWGLLTKRPTAALKLFRP